MKKVLKQIDENYPFVMPNWLLIVVAIIGTIVIVAIESMILFFKYFKATDKVRYFVTQLRARNKTPPLSYQPAAHIDQIEN